MTTSNGKEIKMCLKCYIECDASTYVKYVVFQSPTLEHFCLNIHFIELLSF
jgi:hypothetical protein